MRLFHIINPNFVPLGLRLHLMNKGLNDQGPGKKEKHFLQVSILTFPLIQGVKAGTVVCARDFTDPTLACKMPVWGNSVIHSC
jgi:hypothetical protein